MTNRADKRKAYLILDVENYIAKWTEQLESASFCSRLNEGSTAKHVKIANLTISKSRKQELLTNSIEEIRIPHFRILPKICKPYIPGRPQVMSVK